MKGTLHGGRHDGRTVEVHPDDPLYEDWIRVVILPPVTAGKSDEDGHSFHSFKGDVEVYMRKVNTLDYYYDKDEKW